MTFAELHIFNWKKNKTTKLYDFLKVTGSLGGVHSTWLVWDLIWGSEDDLWSLLVWFWTFRGFNVSRVEWNRNSEPFNLWCFISDTWRSQTPALCMMDEFSCSGCLWLSHELGRRIITLSHADADSQSRLTDLRSSARALCHQQTNSRPGIELSQHLQALVGF